MKDILVIYDKEESYARKLMEYINSKKTWPYLALAFTDEKALTQYLNTNEAEILLTCEFTKNIEDTFSGITFVLYTGNVNTVRTDVRYINKYQSCDEMIKDISDIKSAIENENLNRANTKKDKAKISCVFSPSSDQIRDVFAFSYARFMAESENTLFMDMTYYSGFDRICSIPSDRNLSDLLYYSKQKRKDVMAKLGSMTTNRFGFDIVPGVSIPKDLYGTSSSSFIELIDKIAAEGAYDQIVIDMAVPFFEIMDMSDRIFIPLKNDHSDDIKAECFFETLGNSRFNEMSSRIEKLYHPSENIQVSSEFFEGLLYGEYGNWLSSLFNRQVMV